jgi:hypothetical protein
MRNQRKKNGRDDASLQADTTRSPHSSLNFIGGENIQSLLIGNEGLYIQM